MKIGMIGTGNMGKAVTAAAEETHHDIAINFDINKKPTADAVKECDVLIDFTTANALLDNVKVALEAGLPFVTGTTNWQDQYSEIKNLVEKHNGSFLYAANFSIGVLLFQKLVGHAAQLYSSFENFDFAVHETHHSGKIDSPSGTANVIGETILQSLPQKKNILNGNPQGKILNNQLQISSTRVGAASGTHRVFIDSSEDSIELVHTARGRAGFARGAIRAAEWLLEKKGFFTINDMLTEVLKENKILQ